MVWQEIGSLTADGLATEQELWADRINPVNGQLVGDDEEIMDGMDDVEISQYSLSRAGPNFANGANDTYVIYSYRENLAPRNTPRNVGALKYTPGASCTADISDCFDTSITPLISGGAGVSRAVVYSTEEEEFESLGYDATVIYRRNEVTSLGTNTVTLNTASVDDWAGGGTTEVALSGTGNSIFGRLNVLDAVTTANAGDTTVVAITEFLDAGDVRQVTNLYVDGALGEPFIGQITGQQFGVSADPDFDRDKFNPFMWDDPATSKIYMVTRVDGPDSGGTPVDSKIAVWYFDDTPGVDAWKHLATLNSEEVGDERVGGTLPRPYVLSPEPFIWDGRSYVVLSTSDNFENDQATDGEIFVIQLSDNLLKMGATIVDWSRLVSDDSAYGVANRSRFEGEVFVVDGDATDPQRPIIYYTAIQDPVADMNCPYGLIPGDVTFRSRAVLRKAEVCPPLVSTGVCAP